MILTHVLDGWLVIRIDDSNSRFRRMVSDNGTNSRSRRMVSDNGTNSRSRRMVSDTG